MTCTSCGSEGLLKLTGEISIHFSGMAKDGPPGVVSEFVVCLGSIVCAILDRPHHFITCRPLP